VFSFDGSDKAKLSFLGSLVNVIVVSGLLLRLSLGDIIATTSKLILGKAIPQPLCHREHWMVRLRIRIESVPEPENWTERKKLNLQSGTSSGIEYAKIEAESDGWEEAKKECCQNAPSFSKAQLRHLRPTFRFARLAETSWRSIFDLDQAIIESWSHVMHSVSLLSASSSMSEHRVQARYIHGSALKANNYNVAKIFETTRFFKRGFVPDDSFFFFFFLPFFTEEDNYLLSIPFQWL